MGIINPHTGIDEGEGSGPLIAPDCKKFATTVALEEVCFLMAVITAGPSAILELHAYMADRWNSTNPEERRPVAEKSTALFFSEEAYQRYEQASRLDVAPQDLRPGGNGSGIIKP